MKEKYFIYLQKKSCTRQFESKLSLRSFAFSLQKNLIKNILITQYRIHYEGIKRNKDREEPPGGIRW